MTTSTSSRAAAVPLHHVEHCMGTVFSIRVASPGVQRWDLTLAMAWLRDMDALFSTYRETSQISRLNAGTLRMEETDGDVRAVLTECERFRRLTDGYFDARFDGHNLDPSGYVKGWAIQQVSDKLVAAGSINHCVNGGGDVVCMGRPNPDRPWRIGVADPLRAGTMLRTVAAVGPIAVATSGPAERGAHIVDPHRGVPATDLASVTVVAAELVIADVYATAAVAMGTRRAIDWLQRQDAITATLVTTDGDVIDIERDSRTELPNTKE